MSATECQEVFLDSSTMTVSLITLEEFALSALQAVQEQMYPFGTVSFVVETGQLFPYIQESRGLPDVRLGVGETCVFMQKQPFGTLCGSQGSHCFVPQPCSVRVTMRSGNTTAVIYL